MNSCAPAVRERAWLGSAFTCRQKPLTFAYPGFLLQWFEMPRCARIAAELATIAVPTSCMWTWGAYGGGSEARVTPSEASRSPLDRVQRQGAGYLLVGQKSASGKCRTRPCDRSSKKSSRFRHIIGFRSQYIRPRQTGETGLLVCRPEKSQAIQTP